MLMLKNTISQILKIKNKSTANNILPAITNSSNLSSLLFKHKICHFTTNSKSELKNEKITINVGNAEVNESVDISTLEVVDAERVINISDVYAIKKNKMAPRDVHGIINKSRFEHSNVKLRNFNRDEFEESGREEDRKYIPVSPRLGPFEILDPKMEGKTYHWCSCGMSMKQPFCDGSHRNSKFRPVSFKLGEKVESMLLCGCKLSKLAPFCDRKTCVTLKAKEEEEINGRIEEDKK